jgi:hypothetical protein
VRGKPHHSDYRPAAEVSVESALKGDFTLLIMRLLSDHKLSRNEGVLLAKLLHGLNPILEGTRSHTRSHRLSEAELKQIAFSYELLKTLNPKRSDKDVIEEVCCAHSVSTRTVYNARMRHKSDPQHMQQLVRLLGPNFLRKLSALYRKLDVLSLDKIAPD